MIDASDDEINNIFQEFKKDLNVYHISLYIVSYYEIRENLLFILLINSFIVIALFLYNIQIYVEGSYFQKYGMNFDLKFLPKVWVKGNE